MGNPKRTGKFGLVRTGSATGTASPKLILVVDDANIVAEPFNYERANNVTPDDIGVQNAGFDYTLNADGIEPDAQHFGYLLWLALGGQSIVSNEHVLVPADLPEYFESFIDRIQDIGSGSEPTQTAVGCMITGLSLDVQKRAFVKMSIQGKACDRDDPIAALTASLPNFPLSWHGLRAGDFKIAYDGGVLASSRDINSIKLDYSREIGHEDNITLDSDQPDSLTPHSRTLEFELTRQFAGANAKAEFLAWQSQQEVAISLAFSMDSGNETVLIEVAHARPTGSYLGGVGSGDDTIVGTLKCKAFQSGADPLIKATVKDGTIVDYT